MGHKFVKFPRMWQVCMAERRMDASAYRVALYLLDRANFSDHVPLGNRILAKHGVGRTSKWRALHQLAQAGLIGIERQQGKAPVVKVRWTR
jgi:hypothetical protein